MVSLAFVLSFVVSAVAMLIGIIIFTEIEDGMIGTFGEPLLIENGTLVKVPIVHAFDEYATYQQKPVGENPYEPIHNISLTSGNFTAGNQYLLVFHSNVGQHSGFSDFPNLYVKSLHGNTDFANSEMSLELPQGATSAKFTYQYFTVWTAVAGEDLTMQYRSDSTRSVNAQMNTITAIELEEFTENEDWFFDTRTTSDDLSEHFSNWSTTNPSITLTANGSDDWWVFANSGFSNVGDFIYAESRINLDDTTLTPHHIQQGEDEITDKQLFYLTRTYTPSASSHTFELESRVQTPCTSAICVEVGIREYGSIFAINLDKFSVHENFYLSDIQDIGSTGSAFDTEAGTLTIDPTQTIDVFAQSFLQSDTVTGSCCFYMRQQVGDVDTPTLTNSLSNHHWGGDDIISWVSPAIINLDSATNVDLDVGAFGQSGSDTSDVWDISIVAFTMSVDTFTPDIFESQVPAEFAQSSSIALTVMGVLPIVLFFALFSILSGRGVE